MSSDEAKQLILKYRSGRCTDKEVALLESWYIQLGEKNISSIPEPELEMILAKIWSALPVHEPALSAKIVPINAKMEDRRSARLWLRSAAAAILIVGLLGLGRLLIFKRTVPVRTAMSEDSILPGGNKAVLILSDQSKIDLSAINTGGFTKQGNIIIRKNSPGLIAYQTGAAIETGFNTLETPNGGQFQLILPDGTKVWLNAASRLTYPISFTGLKERRIKLTGEAYFEVRHDLSKPFFVETSELITEDIGTAFNINSYENEPGNSTTLVAGSVRVMTVNRDTSKKQPVKSRVLTPGEQAVIRSGVLQHQRVDTDRVTDWKNEEFIFDHLSIEEIMRKIARWYDVRVIFKKNVDKSQTFGGQVPRSAALRQVLKSLEATGHVRFIIKGRTITVSDPGRP